MLTGDCVVVRIFQSTLPVRGGTFVSTSGKTNPYISIHPPRAGRDNIGRSLQKGHWNFNPPSPCGEGRRAAYFFRFHVEISIHPPRAGRDASHVVLLS